MMKMILMIFCSVLCDKPCNTAECDANSLATDGISRKKRIKITCNISDKTKSFNIYTRWYPAADQFSLLEIPDPDCKIRNLSENGTIVISTQKIGVEPHVIRKGDFTIAYLSALIRIDNGNITGISWDKYFDSNSCKDKRVAHDDTCYVYNPTSSKCNGNSFKIFLGFFGKDSKGVPLKSAGLMPSTFLRRGVNNIIEDAQNL